MPQASSPHRITLITPVYNESEGLQAYVDEVRATLMERHDCSVDVLFVDDGSADDSWDVIQKIVATHPEFRGIRLSRNFGSHTAISAGLDHLEPDVDAAVVLAADLQDPPTTVLEFVDRWRRGAEIVWGRRTTRLDSRWRVVASRVFHRMLRRHAMPAGSQFTTGSFFLIDRKVIDAVAQFEESNRITFALVAWTGFEQDTVDYARRKRVAGSSGWTFTDMIRAMYDAFVGFSGLPIKMMEGAALMSLGIAILLSIYLVVASLTGLTQVPGWTSQMLLLAVFFGIQFWLIAILGQYLARIHREVVRRPLYFVSRDTIDGSTSTDEAPPETEG